MLVLSRKVGESIIINHCIKITVTKVENGKVRIGVEAPPDIPVHREEIFMAMQESTEAQLVCMN